MSSSQSGGLPASTCAAITAAGDLEPSGMLSPRPSFLRPPWHRTVLPHTPGALVKWGRRGFPAVADRQLCVRPEAARRFGMANQCVGFSPYDDSSST